MPLYLLAYARVGRAVRLPAVLAVAAITPTPAEEGLARLSEALASPAVVNNGVLWTGCGALDKMAPHSTMQLHFRPDACF